MIPEAADAAAFCFIGVDGERVVVAPAGVTDVVGTSADSAIIPAIHDVEYQGACTPMVGCKAEGGFHARKRTPATSSPWVPVACNGIRRPLQVTT